ncbi:hypothetical protein C5C00_12205 [Rathayibacter rathayi]|nr:hypothetical protein C5C47_07790 [Rathayibacter rathayi]PPG94445.1 hypothetical protein C5C00_12205 [Rathayibacter rathayi]
MVLFAVAAMAAAWTWSRASPSRRSGWLIALAGALLALSVTSKLTTAVLAYLPLHPVEAIRYLLDFPSEHNADGHLTEVVGFAYVFPPWWANLWVMLAGIGPVALAVLLLGTLLALLAPRCRALVLYLGDATLLLLVFHLVISAVALPHYYAAWAWLLCALAGIGIAEALRGGMVLPAPVARGAGGVAGRRAARARPRRRPRARAGHVIRRLRARHRRSGDDRSVLRRDRRHRDCAVGAVPGRSAGHRLPGVGAPRDGAARRPHARADGRAAAVTAETASPKTSAVE